jgi:hypothetical protein
MFTQVLRIGWFSGESKEGQKAQNRLRVQSQDTPVGVVGPVVLVRGLLQPC